MRKIALIIGLVIVALIGIPFALYKLQSTEPTIQGIRVELGEPIIATATPQDAVNYE